MNGVPEDEHDTGQTADSPEAAAPASEADAAAQAGARPAATLAPRRAWPYLTLDEIDRGWQQATNDGPAMMGRQVAYALAISLRREPVKTEEDGAPPPDPVQSGLSGVLALAAYSDALSIKQRIQFLEEILVLPEPAPRARALLMLAPHLPSEQSRRTLHSAYQSTLEVADIPARARLLLDLLPMLGTIKESDLPTGITAEALDLAGSIPNTEARLRGLTALAFYLPSAARIALLLAVLDTIATMSHSDGQAGALIALAPHLVEEVHHRALTVAAHIPEPAPRARALTTLAQILPAPLQQRLQAAALEAIAVIPNESERATALVAFAPHLDSMGEQDEAFPVLLERALAIAVTMNRRDSRAEALVALQARLPRNLQGEALAAVNTITNEHTRAQLLANLAPSLAPDMAMGALVVAHNIRQRDARFLALKALGRRLEGKAAERTWLDALAVAVALPRQLERVLALAELVPYLPDELRYRTLSNALTTARSITMDRAQVRALSTLAPLLAEQQQLLADALADAHTITNPVEKVSALIALVPYLPQGEATDRTLDEILSDLRDVPVEYRQARSLTTLAPYLYGARLETALELGQGTADPYDRASILVALLPHLENPTLRAAILQRALESTREITDSYDRATALTALWAQASPEMRPEITRAALNAVHEIGDEYDRASGISVFAPLLASEEAPSALPSESKVLRDTLLAVCQLDAPAERAAALQQIVGPWGKMHPPAVAYALWCEALALLSRRPLSHLLNDLVVLAPVIRDLGGEGAVQQAAQAIAAARHW